jgi:hypothetical protein
MQLEDIFFAKFAELTPDGLFTAVGGGLNRINTAGFPWAWGFLFLVVRIRLTTEEAKAPHATSIERETPDGQTELITPESPMLTMPPTADLGPDGRVGLTFILCLANLVFREAGVYKYRFKIDGQEVGVAKLFLVGPTQGDQGR